MLCQVNLWATAHQNRLHQGCRCPSHFFKADIVGGSQRLRILDGPIRVNRFSGKKKSTKIKLFGVRRLPVGWGSSMWRGEKSCVALRGCSLRGFWDVRGFPFCSGKKVWDSLLWWGKGSETPSFPRSEHEERGSLRPLSPSQEGVSDHFSHRKRGNPVHPKIPLVLESGTLWGANFAKKIAKHGGHACLEVTRKNFTFVKFFRATSEAKSHYFPSGSLFFPKKWPKPTRKMTFLMSSWPFVALVLRIPWNTYKNSVLERVRLGSKAL